MPPTTRVVGVLGCNNSFMIFDITNRQQRPVFAVLLFLDLPASFDGGHILQDTWDWEQ